MLTLFERAFWRDVGEAEDSKDVDMRVQAANKIRSNRAVHMRPSKGSYAASETDRYAAFLPWNSGA